MAKKKSITMIYLVGMLATAVGFILPIFRKTIEMLGNTTVVFSKNGFDLVGDGNSTLKIMALLVFIGAIVGVICSVLPKIPQARIIKFIALVVSLAGGVYCYFNTGDFIKDVAIKVVSVGFYMIIAGWILALVGWFTNK